MDEGREWDGEGRMKGPIKLYLRPEFRTVYMVEIHDDKVRSFSIGTGLFVLRLEGTSKDIHSM